MPDADRPSRDREPWTAGLAAIGELSLDNNRSDDSGRLIRFLALNAAIGAVAGGIAASAILLADVGGLATLLTESDSHMAGGALLYGGFAVTFASLAMGTAVMMLPRK
jgi:hypothetical protein